MIVSSPLKARHRERLYGRDHIRFTWLERAKIATVMAAFAVMFLYVMATLVSK